MHVYNPSRRSSDYCRNYYDDYCDYDHHYDFYRKSGRGRYHDRLTVKEVAAVNTNLYTIKYK